MESITKYRQSPQMLIAMIERAYGQDVVPIHSDGWHTELGHGFFSAAYRIRLRDERHVVLKIAPPPQVELMTYERYAMRTELRALELISERTDVPVPNVDYADLSHELCDADYFFMPYVDADNLANILSDLPPDQVHDHMVELGDLNRRINSISGPAFGPLDGPGSPDWRTTFTRMVDGVLSDGERRKVDLGVAYDTVRNVFAAHADYLDDVTEPRLVEWDLWPGNVLVGDGRIVAIIDHERAFYGDPLMEIGFAGTQSPHFSDAAAFMHGYGHPELTESQAVRRRLYVLHLVLVMVIETVFRGHSDTQQYDWARARLDEVLELFQNSARRR